MEIFIYAFILAFLPALIASSKGKSFALWWVYGFFLFIIALVHSILISSDPKHKEKKQLAEGMKKCPDCAEMVMGDAKVCRFCGHQFRVLSKDEINFLAKKYGIEFVPITTKYMYNRKAYDTFEDALSNAEFDNQ